MIIEHECFECGFIGEVESQSRKVICPNCMTENDFWLEGEVPPQKHVEDKKKE